MSDTESDQWKNISFGDLCVRIVNGGTPSTNNPNYWNGVISWVTGADFNSHGIGEIRRFVSAAGIGASATSVVSSGNLLVVTRTGVGKLAIAPYAIAISQDITGVYIDAKNADTTFIYYLLSKELIELKKLNQGTSINGIIRADLENHQVKIPIKKSIQKKIATILQAIDQTIEKTEALIEKYQQIKSGLMHDLFTRGITADGKLRPPREQAPELYQETAIGWIPKEWEFSPLATKSRFDVPHLKTGPFGSALKSEHWVTEGHPVITIGALGEGEFTIPELLYISDFDATRLSDFKLKNGDVVFSRVADVGRSVVIEEDQVGWIMSSNFVRISLDRDQVLPDFLQYQLAADTRVKRQIRCKVNAGGRDLANSDILNRLFFVWPDPNEQVEIVKRAKAVDIRTRSEHYKLQKLNKQNSGLMHDLLTGKVRVTVDETQAIHDD